uniref:Kinesin-like protein n=1 Tax=Globisporangium ultimum (strain ATCC 200006 / CBS 805.95 / DAOM BR144) TaxID=431595 RepID=K3X358_GLOUD
MATFLPPSGGAGATTEATSIKVFCRLRQQNQLEKREGATECSTVVDGRTIFLRNERCDVDEIRCTFDRVFDIDATQEEVYEHTAKPLVSEFLQGYNCTIFAYGQTGSGKTHTILGPKDGVQVKSEEEGGIISRVVKDLYKEAEKARAMASPAGKDSIELTVSFVEIYMEQIRDLLVSSSGNSSSSNAAMSSVASVTGGLKIRENSQRGIYIEDMTQVPTATETATMELVKAGILNRAVSSTRMNKDSSRSHSILIISCTRKSLKSTVVKRSSMFIVDLAGSEFVNKTHASGKVLQEAKSINKSLSALSNVIKALVEGKKHVPYRDSKLTRILQDSLGGSAKTCLILAASCSSYNMPETISTLRFGLRAKEIKNPVVVQQKQEGGSGLGPGGIFKELYQQSMEEIEEKNKKIDELQRLLSAVYQENQQLTENNEQLHRLDKQEEEIEGAAVADDRVSSDDQKDSEGNDDVNDGDDEDDDATSDEDEELELALREKEELAQKNVTLVEENKRLLHVLEALEGKLDQVAVDFSSGKPILSLHSDHRGKAEGATTAHDHTLSLKIWLQSDKWQQSLEARPKLELIEPSDDTKSSEHSPTTHFDAAQVNDRGDQYATGNISSLISASLSASTGQSLETCASNTDAAPCVHRVDAEALSRQIVELKLQLHYLTESTKQSLDGETYAIVIENAKLKTRIEEFEFQANLSTVTCNQLEMKNRACETRLSNQETHIGCLQNSLQEYQGLFKQQIIMSQEKCRLLTDELEFYKKLAKCGQQSSQHLGLSSSSPTKHINSSSPRKHRNHGAGTSPIRSALPFVYIAIIFFISTLILIVKLDVCAVP